MVVVVLVNRYYICLLSGFFVFCCLFFFFFVFFFFFKQKTAYEIRPRDWSSDVCSSDPLFSYAKYIPDFMSAYSMPKKHANFFIRRQTDIIFDIIQLMIFVPIDRKSVV